MRKFASIPPLVALALGFVGFFFRRQELATAFDASGLPIAGARATFMLLCFSLAAALVCIVLGALLGGTHRAEPEYTKAFSPAGGLLYLALSAIAAIAMLTAGFLLIMQLRSIAALGALQLVLLVLLMLTAASFIILPIRAYRRKPSSLVSIFSIMPPLFFCAWLIFFYKSNAVNPALTELAYQCVALSAAALAFYFASGFAFGKGNETLYVICALLAIYLCAVSAADVIGTPYLIFYAVTVLALIMNTSVFLANLKPKSSGK